MFILIQISPSDIVIYFDVIIYYQFMIERGQKPSKILLIPNLILSDDGSKRKSRDVYLLF